ncbi:aspartyl protease family protein [Flavobacterium luminosum]|uniref:Aspartyl protease family protein n=1 Tax=Flavobacterium luminosum TaxID=2949086 RepID=A0ABT0TM77_9FLAO|nr:aspartyl protease family protein [Flavobacterium sp. HXWNR70]MCL9808594.1 aspartyl protease family protein [Flavobacterium sp. HXWNR70]
MKKLYSLLFLIILSGASFSQDGFQFKSKRSKISIPFETSNNLVIIPVEINGVNLSFLLDTGVDSTILFSLDKTDSIQFNNVEKIKVKGLGGGEPIDALYSKFNKVVVGDYQDKNHDLLIILDQQINFSSQLGIPVHGIIGYQFFKDFPVEVNYDSRNVVVYRDMNYFSKRKLKNFKELPLTIELDKPYVTIPLVLNGNKMNSKMLIDSGSSDALWLFEDTSELIKIPKKNFEDFLGNGFSGEIFGKRSRTEEVFFGDESLQNVTISFPNDESLRNASFVAGRNGSVGSEILKRFRVLYDYKNSKIYLKKNNYFDKPFNFNMSGLQVEHVGMQLVKEEIELKTSFLQTTEEKNVFNASRKSIRYQFTLKPQYQITNVRSGSPADLAGIKKGDILTKVNGLVSYKYKLNSIIELLQSEEGKTIKMEIDRKGMILKTEFVLKDIL